MNWLRNWSCEQLLCVYGDKGFEEHTTEFYHRFGNFIRDRIARLSGHWIPRPAVDEVEGGVWAKLPGAKHTFIPGEEGSGLAWLGQVVTTVTYDFGRKLGKFPESASEEQLDDFAREAPTAESVCEDREAIELVFGALANLPHENQAVMALVEDPGFGLLTLQQAAELVGCSVATVHRRRQDTLDALRHELVEQEDSR